jgi:DNA-binding protein YbaB
MRGNIGQLMKQAQMMQENMRRMQDQLGGIEVEGQSGSGMVR